MVFAFVAAAVAAGVIFRLVDRRADAPVMRRRVNAGTERWQASERERRRSDHHRRGDGGTDRIDDGIWGDGDADDGD